MSNVEIKVLMSFDNNFANARILSNTTTYLATRGDKSHLIRIKMHINGEHEHEDDVETLTCTVDCFDDNNHKWLFIEEIVSVESTRYMYIDSRKAMMMLALTFLFRAPSSDISISEDDRAAIFGTEMLDEFYEVEEHIQTPDNVTTLDFKKK